MGQSELKAQSAREKGAEWVLNRRIRCSERARTSEGVQRFFAVGYSYALADLVAVNDQLSKLN
jgi:hypothetical protein